LIFQQRPLSGVVRSQPVFKHVPLGETELLYIKRTRHCKRTLSFRLTAPTFFCLNAQNKQGSKQESKKSHFLF